MNDLHAPKPQVSPTRAPEKGRAGFFLPCILLPLLLGAMLYYVFRPDVILTQWLRGLTRIEIPPELREIGRGRRWGMVLRCFAADFLWAYSLAMALLWIREVYHRSLLMTLLVCVCTDLAMESLQLLPFFRGVFDPLDILVQIGGAAAALGTVFLYHAAGKRRALRQERLVEKPAP